MTPEWTFCLTGFIAEDTKRLTVSVYGYPMADNPAGAVWEVPIKLPDGEVEPTPEWVRELLVSVLEGL